MSQDRSGDSSASQPPQLVRTRNPDLGIEIACVAMPQLHLVTEPSELRELLESHASDSSELRVADNIDRKPKCESTFHTFNFSNSFQHSRGTIAR